MPRPIRWRQLVPGLVALAGLVGAVASILIFARVGSPNDDPPRLYVATDNATGVIRGTEVWLMGEKIGQVRGTSLRPVSVDTSQRVLVTVDILRYATRRIRRDSRAQIRPGGSMVGQAVVYFSGGTDRSPAVIDGDTIISRPHSALDETRAQFTEAASQVPALKDEVESLTTQLFSTHGTIGAASGDDGKLTTLSVDLAHHARLGGARRDAATSAARNAFIDHTLHLMATADSLHRIVSSPSSTLGRIERDTVLLNAIRGVRAELDTTQRLLQAPVGTVGRLAVDSAIRRRLAVADSSLHALSEDAATRPFRYLPF